MKEEKYPTNENERRRIQLRRRKTEGKKCDKEQTEENKRIQKDKIIDEEEDENANYSKKKR